MYKGQKEAVLKKAKELGIDVEVNHPGDGSSRYHFVNNKFEWSKMCTGISEAEIFVIAYERGRQDERKSNGNS